MISSLIGLTGYATSGKDSVASVLVLYFGYTRSGLADPLKKMAYDINPMIWFTNGEVTYLSYLVDDLGWDEAKQIPEVRRFLQNLGTEGVRNNIGENVWADLLFKRMNGGIKYVVPDVRFPNESKAIKEWGGVVWKVSRPGAGIGLSHASEAFIDQIVPDETIVNDGTLADLENAVLQLAHKY